MTLNVVKSKTRSLVSKLYNSSGEFIMNLRYLTGSSILILFLVMIVNAQNIRQVNEIQTQSNQDIIKLMMSEDPKESVLASKEVFARGEQMIPLLLELEGNSKCYYGIKALGDWDMPGLVRESPSCHATSAYQVTAEIAALYMISAIFNDDLAFASPPVLCDFSSEEKECAEGGNTPKRILKAWQATKNWNLSLQTKGLSYLRQENQEPLKNSGLAFY